MDAYSLYLVISEEYGLGRSALEMAHSAVGAGVDIVQLREKNKPNPELLKIACAICALCKEKGVKFIVNDDPLIAKQSNADGVHLGQEDLRKHNAEEIRSILGENKLIGVSTHSLLELGRANDDPQVDYMAYGPIFPTRTKNYYLGTKDIKQALNIARKPIFFIGGINLSNLEEILAIGAKNIALIRGIIGQEDIAAAAKAIKKQLVQAGAKIIVKINGQEQAISRELNLAQLILSRGYDAKGKIVAEHNLRIVAKPDWQNVILKENDSIEIISFMGGG